MKRVTIESLVRANIAALSPYSTARDEYQGELGVFLDANESPYDNGYNRYPDPHQKRLKARLSEIKGIEAKNIFVGNGSDEAIDLMFRVFCEPAQDNAVAIAPSYGMYKVSAAINNIEMREVQLGEDFSLPVDALLGACDQNTKLMFVCSPNNPTGNSFPRKDILSLAEEFEGMLVVDEAYIDFAEAESLKSEIERYPNIVVLQTMSKAWAMAGLRLGLALADSRVVEIMSQVKYPYNINKAALQIVEQLLDEPIDDKVREIVEQRGVVAERLAAMPFVSKVYPSDANFVLARVDDADAIYEHLIADGIIVRNRNRVRGCEGCLRITIGTKQENEKLIQSLERYE
jgi:histidinol-phosphate aminotransferase